MPVYVTPSSSEPLDSMRIGSGEYYVPQGCGGSSSNGFSSYEKEWAIPIYIPETYTFSAICCYCDTLTASSVARLGIRYPHASSGGPGTLLLDAGTVSTATTGAKEIAISQQLTKGWWWLTAAMQVATGARLRAAATYAAPFGCVPNSSTQATAPDKQIWEVAAAGAFAANPTFAVINSGAQGPVLVFLKR